MEQLKIENLDMHDFSNHNPLKHPSYTSAQELFALCFDGIGPLLSSLTASALLTAPILN
jgi:hypothetical protein